MRFWLSARQGPGRIKVQLAYRMPRAPYISQPLQKVIDRWQEAFRPELHTIHRALVPL